MIDGLLVIGLLWWTWAAYTWLGNQARADEGLLRAGMALATARGGCAASAMGRSAIGESIVAIGSGAATSVLSASL